MNSDTPKMNSACRQIIKNWLQVATHHNDIKVVKALETLLEVVKPLEGEVTLTQSEIDRMVDAEEGYFIDKDGLPKKRGVK